LYRYILEKLKEVKQMDNKMTLDFEIEEVENVEALSEASNWFFVGLGVGVLVGIAAC
jgi:hypothetical protein